MSTQPIPRLRLAAPHRRHQGSAVALIVLVLASIATFAAVYAVARAHSSSAPSEPLQAGLPALSEPVPSTLGAAPPIEVGVSGAGAESRTAPAAGDAASSVQSAPVAATSPVEVQAAATTPEASAPSTTPAQPPHTSSPKSSESGPGTSFDSSG